MIRPITVRSLKSLALTAAVIAPLSGAALAQEAGSGFVGTPERAITTQAPREFTARRLIETRQQAPVAASQADRNAVPSSGGGVY